MHVCAENVHCSEWNNFMLIMLPGQEFVIPAIDGKRDVATNLAKVQFLGKKQKRHRQLEDKFKSESWCKGYDNKKY